MERRTIVGGIAALLLLLFVYSATAKLIDPAGFRGNMFNQDIPRWMAMLLIWVVPGSEIWVAGCLLMAHKRRTGLVGSLVLLIVYTIYIAAILLHFFHRTPCPCGGIFHRMGWEQHLWFNVGCMLLTIWAIILDSKGGPIRQSFFQL